MQISRTSATAPILFLAVALLGLAYPTQASAEGAITAQASPACEDFAQRQVQLADRLLNQSNYSRALKVLNSTAKNCDIEMVREKIVEVLGQWYGVVRGQGSNSIRNFLEVLSAQPHVSAAQKAQVERRIAAQVRGFLEREYDGDNYRAAYRLCRSYPEYSSDNFEAQYYCGRSAEEVEAEGAAMNYYRWLVQNWDGDQSLATWKDVADRLEALYYQNGRFKPAYKLARQRARRDPSPRKLVGEVSRKSAENLKVRFDIGCNSLY